MSSIDRPLAGRPLHFRLGGEERSCWIDAGLLARGGRSARTLVKEGPLRVTLVALAAGGGLAEHRADGPITVQVLSGHARFRAGGEAWALEPGDLLTLAAGVPHSVESVDGAELLVTVAAAPGAQAPAPRSEGDGPTGT